MGSEFSKRKILTHPKELTRENLEEWRKKFVKKIGRTTTRTDLDRLILAVERREFKNDGMADWTEVIFENGLGKVTSKYGSEEFEISEFERKILDQNENLKNKEIKKSALKEENGEWTLDGSLKEISRGGEAVVLEETIAGLKVAARVACFDSALFTADMDDCSFEWHLSKDFEIAENREDEAAVIPRHENVIAHFANCEIIQDGEVVGWITVMELCETDLRKLLKNKNGSPTIEERKKIAIGLRKGDDYLKMIGIYHEDRKPENILMKNGNPKWTDFGLIGAESGRESYRQMGYARRGSKFRSTIFLYAGSAAFAGNSQLGQTGNYNSALGILILCDWNTAWTLLFKPLEKGEKEEIKKELQSFNAGWMTNAQFSPKIEEIKQLTGTITLKNASSNLNLDDENLTKSCAMAQLKQRMARVENFDFINLTKNVLDQKDSNLCVPISVSVLLRWAIKNDLKVGDDKMEKFTVEKILTKLTMIIYPRSLAGMNLNPKNEEKEFQQGEIELLLKRMKNKTYLHRSGWDLIRGIYSGTFDFNQVLLHTRFTPTRPLTVTTAYAFSTGEVFFHQMILDRVENDEYVLQNTLHASQLEASQRRPLVRIDRQKRYYADYQTMLGLYDRNRRDFIYRGANNEFMLLTSAGEPTMNFEEFYLLPQAYSITLTPLQKNYCKLSLHIPFNKLTQSC